MARAGRRSDENFAKDVEKHRAIGSPPADVGLAWLLAHPAVTAPIVGPRTVAQLEDAVKAADLALDPETLRRLEEIWPGPGGEAPKAFAW